MGVFPYMSDIHKALRNKQILDWYRALPLISPDRIVLTRSKIAIDYATHLRCPPCEIVSDFTDQDDINYLWERYRILIDIS